MISRIVTTLYCMLRSVCVFCTIKNLQHIKLLLSVETLKGDGDVVSFLYCDAPRTHLQVGVAFRPTGAQDDARRVVSHIMRGTLDCGAVSKMVACVNITCMSVC